MLIVKKFGGSSVADKERIFNVAKRCIEDYEAGNDVVVVLSAMGKTTDRLIEMARDINPKASKREMDMLLATGEQTSVALMSMAMQSLGVSAVSLNAFQVVMHTTSAYSNAKFKRIDTERIFNELEQRRIVIITGFQGVRPEDQSEDPVKGLDVSLLQNLMLTPVLGITDPKTDPRIDFVGGIRGTKELEKRCHEDAKAAFAMYPTSIGELFAVADAGLLMPPKSTWFEPKLRSGLFIHLLNE